MNSLPILKLAGIILVIVTLLAGIYPALIMSRIKPVQSLKGKLSTARGTVSLRKSLVVFQFSVSIILIIGAVVVASQLDYMRNKKLGFDKEHVLVLAADNKMFGEYDALHAEIKKLNFIKEVSASSVSPTEIVIGHGIFIDGLSDELRVVGGVHVSDNFIQTMGIQLISGRNFTTHQNILTDSGAFEFIVNQTFLTKFGLSEAEALGREMNLGGRGKIIGIVQDFHPGSLHQKIEPIVMFAKPHPYIPLRKMIIKLEPGNVQNQLSELGTLWKRLVVHRPFNYNFLDESYDSLYKTEVKIYVLVYAFSGLAIVIACLGILGLASYSAIQRTKEIGVRKVLGASVLGIMTLIAKDFLSLIVIAFILAAPLAYYFADNWLQHFEYRIALQLLHFVVAGLLAFVFAICTIAYQAIKSSRLNPALTLRSE
jgi:putative ABC transport system permease protein